MTDTPTPRPLLDWRPRHDERSRSFPVRAVLPGSVPRVRTLWEEGPVLDQGSEGACVGFGWTAEALAAPVRPQPLPATRSAERMALSVYRRAKRVDQWPGEAYSGTSVLAGAKVMARDGLISSYRWCFGPDDLRDSVVAEGPVVLGVPWYEGMYSAPADGLVSVSGARVGGHCILLTGYDPALRVGDTEVEGFRWRNSWGASYGDGGSAWISAAVLDALLADGGEACVPIGRRPGTPRAVRSSSAPTPLLRSLLRVLVR